MDEDKQATERQIEMPRTWEQKSVVRVKGRTGGRADGIEAPLALCSQIPAAVNVLTVAIKGALVVPSTFQQAAPHFPFWMLDARSNVDEGEAFALP